MQQICVYVTLEMIYDELEISLINENPNIKMFHTILWVSPSFFYNIYLHCIDQKLWLHRAIFYYLSLYERVTYVNITKQI